MRRPTGRRRRQHAKAYVPQLDQRAAVAEAARSVFNSPERTRAASAPATHWKG